ncbi:thioredoxin [Prevotella sp. A2931]|uniref:Thioredoxin n=1 Tax=Prevotella illustrans TaxID=2800387 RepID=A0ABS3M5M3_9BACT|nr:MULTISPECIES: thioredoxin [Prevotella]MBO1363483.1 thioredoxin [Prevotella illustrans]PTL26069.1 thioredoxin [Prevotella sp. oral taxon 820]
MKKATFVLLVTTTLTLTACSPQNKKNHQTTNNVNKELKVKEKKNMTVTELTTSEFKKKVMDFDKHPQEWVFEGDKPAIIDFYATWCGPCKATAPILEELANDYAGKLDIYKVDVDQQQELAALFGVRSIPSLLFIPKQGNPQMQVGAMNKQQFEAAIKSTLLK